MFEFSSTFKLNSDRKLMIVLIVVVIFSRLPFLGAGFGTDPDAWRLANASEHIAEYKEYVFSREPGHPLQEIACALIVSGGAWVVNSSTAVMSLMAVLLFSLALRNWGFKDHFWAGMLLAFIPIFYVNSVNAMDYNWAMAFAMASMYLLSRWKLAAAGVCLGLAVGCRVTSGALFVPLAIMMVSTNNTGGYGDHLKNIVKFGLAGAVVSALVYIPVFIEYGSSFWRFYDVSEISLERVIRLATFGVWGHLGVWTLASVLGLLMVFPGLVCRPDYEGNVRARSLVRASVVAIALYLVAFLRLPVEAAYLMPLLPFVVLLLALCLKKWVMVGVCVFMMMSCFLDLSFVGNSPRFNKGMILREHATRVRGVDFAERVIRAAELLPGKSVIVAAWWRPHLLYYKNRTNLPNCEFIYSVDQAGLQTWVADGYNVYHLPLIEAYNRDYNDVDLRTVSTPLNVAY